MVFKESSQQRCKHLLTLSVFASVNYWKLLNVPKKDLLPLCGILGWIQADLTLIKSVLGRVRNNIHEVLDLPCA